MKTTTAEVESNELRVDSPEAPRRDVIVNPNHGVSIEPIYRAGRWVCDIIDLETQALVKVTHPARITREKALRDACAWLERRVS